jgi:hypothetical protein
MFMNQFFHDRLQLGIAFGCWKYFLLFGDEVDDDFLFHDLLDFGLPGFGVNFPSLQSSIQTHAQCERMLVLVRKRDQVFVTKHVTIIAV